MMPGTDDSGVMRRRRNSTGTIFLSNTMSLQDNEATITAACMVIRSHMLEAEKENIVPIAHYDVFRDAAFQNKDLKLTPHQQKVPSLETVKEFFLYLFSKSQLESDCIIMALIYCERLVKETKGRLCIRYDNWKSILFACLVMASKVWDDLSMWNVDFSQVYPSFDLRRVNTLELAMLDALKYVIRVSASEYAKYYFHLRSMMTRTGLLGEPSNAVQPLDLAGARKLQLSTENFEASMGGANKLTTESTRRRFYSVYDAPSAAGEQSDADASNLSAHKQLAKSVHLEMLMHTDHMDADGQVHLNKNASFKSDKKPLTPMGSTKRPAVGSDSKMHK
jgi:hypothetical protein